MPVCESRKYVAAYRLQDLSQTKLPFADRYCCEFADGSHTQLPDKG